MKLGLTLQFLYCLASVCDGEGRRTGHFMSACQGYVIWCVEHLAKVWEALSSCSVPTYCSAGFMAQRLCLVKEYPAVRSLQHALVAEDAAEYGTPLVEEG